MIYTVLLTLTLALVNGWHAYLLLNWRDDNKPESISEHAASAPRNLLIHRLIHIVVSVSFGAYGFLFLASEQDLLLPAILLISGAVFDIIEVLTLNENTKPGPQKISDPHQMSAWAMAFCYMFFGIVITVKAGFPIWVTHAVWLVFVGMLSGAAYIKFKKFWAFQMIYFLLLSSIILAAHSRL